jgi:8-oxo-dGTP pyrophosphatase MutT (NUDIX family)
MSDSLFDHRGDLPMRLARRLEQPLPGRIAQRRFAPSLGYGRHHGPAPFDARSAAVLMLLYFQDGWRLPMTLRPDTLPSHAGQVSFPGGMIDPGETVEQAAVRELEEELGVPRQAVRVLGRLTPLYVWASNFCVTPLLGVTETAPRFVPNPAEVAEVIDVPLATIVDRAHHGEHTIRHRALVFRSPHIEVEGQIIWGASCMMLGELAVLLEEL